MGKKEEYLAKLEAQLKEWGIEIESLKAKAASATADARTKYEEVISRLVAKSENLRQKLTELKKAGDEAWVDLQVGLENAREDLRAAIENAISKFK